MEIIVDPQAAQGWMFAGGFKQIDGKWYYFCSDGSMSANTAIDGYTIGPDGAGSLLRTVSGKSIKRLPNRYRKEEEILFAAAKIRFARKSCGLRRGKRLAAEDCLCDSRRHPGMDGTGPSGD